MTTTTCKTANQAAKVLQRIADNYAGVYECTWIASDMAIYIESRIKGYAESMKNKAVGKFSYNENFYIRHRGVETEKERVEKMDDKLIAIVTVKYNKMENIYTIIKANI